MQTMNRRAMLQVTMGMGASLAVGAAQAKIAGTTGAAPVRVITHGPKHHWFGYYDKLEFDPTSRYVLGMEVDFEHRSPRASDVIRIGMVDLEDGDRWQELGQSAAWCWQQGCMLQWRPGAAHEVLWNDRGKDGYICRILNVKSREARTVPHPIYAVSPNGKIAVAPDFRRINDTRPGYGYVGFPDPHGDDLAPRDSGIFQVDLESGQQQLIISLADVARFGNIPHNQPDVKHYFNHLLFNPDGSRFVFLHRWKFPKGNWLTRMLTADPDGKNLRVIDDNGMTSHFIWRDPRHILAFSRQPSHGARFYVFTDGDRSKTEVVGPDVLVRDGHCTYLPDTRWIIDDTYPDKTRRQNVFLYHVPTGKKVELGAFPAPLEYSGEWRCDTHPRHSPDGRKIVIDAPHANEGRQLYLIDISQIIA